MALDEKEWRDIFVNLSPEQQETMSKFLALSDAQNFPPELVEEGALRIAGRSQQGNSAGQTINQSSVSAEADLLLGGNGEVLTALAASGVDNQQQVRDAAAEFALIAQQAIQNGQPLSQVRFSDPNLSQEAIEAIYEQVAVKSGTSAAEVERKAEEARQAEMAMIQNGVMGLAGVAAATKVQSGASGFSLFAGDNEQALASESGQGLAYFDPALLGTLAPGVQDMRSNEQKLARSGGMALS